MSDTLNSLNNIYSAIKAARPIHTTVNPGVNIQKLVYEEHEGLYKYFMLKRLDWTDIDGVLDYLYGLRDICGFARADEIIKTIEKNVTITYG